ncbi:MAG: 3-hydroxylacyl-ACP dehydratase [Acidiferrobacterales bacterium]
MQLDRAQICQRIPHAGDMCLLDKMLAWDETHIKCSARSHLNPANPLRTGNTLTVMAAIEYAGQAMALHGGLITSESPGGNRPRKGYLASLRNIVVGRPVLDDLPGDLLIEVELLMGDNDSSLYVFAVSTANTSVITGRAAVKLLEEMET